MMYYSFYRNKLCSASSKSSDVNCNIFGLSYLGTACAKYRNCAVNKDDGFTLATVITHTIGHL